MTFQKSQTIIMCNTDNNVTIQDKQNQMGILIFETILYSRTNKHNYFKKINK